MAEEPAGGTGEWYSSRSDHELEYLKSRANAADPHYRIVVDEIERRRAERSERTQLRWIQLTFWTTLALGVAGIAVTLAR